MKYYQEITLIDGDKSLYQLWSDLYNQLHIALAELKNTHGIDSVGISFPNYKYQQKEDGREFSFLGNKLRIFSDKKETLEVLNINTKVIELNQRQDYKDNADDYFHTKSIRPIPENIDGYLVVSRFRPKTLKQQVENYLLLAERQGRTVSQFEAIEHCTLYKHAGRRKYPFIMVTSQTTKEKHPFFFKQEAVDSELIGIFNTYGINTAKSHNTVPHW